MNARNIPMNAHIRKPERYERNNLPRPRNNPAHLDTCNIYTHSFSNNRHEQLHSDSHASILFPTGSKVRARRGKEVYIGRARERRRVRPVRSHAR